MTKTYLLLPVAKYDGTTEMYEVYDICRCNDEFELLKSVEEAIENFKVYGKEIDFELSKVFISGRHFNSNRNGYNLVSYLSIFENKYHGGRYPVLFELFREHGYENVRPNDRRKYTNEKDV